MSYIVIVEPHRGWFSSRTCRCSARARTVFLACVFTVNAKLQPAHLGKPGRAEKGFELCSLGLSLEPAPQYREWRRHRLYQLVADSCRMDTWVRCREMSFAYPWVLGWCRLVSVVFFVKKLLVVSLVLLVSSVGLKNEAMSSRRHLRFRDEL
ncbi:unnamed protein product [Ectocarpus fasciculatus]